MRRSISRRWGSPGSGCDRDEDEGGDEEDGDGCDEDGEEDGREDGGGESGLYGL